MDAAAEPSWLARTQRRLRQLITAPDGVRRALADEGDAQSAGLDALVRSDSRLDSAERLGVYANAYFYRILECLEHDYPALRASLGQALFHDLVTAYLITHPPRHPSLRYAGDRLAGYLEESDRAAPFRRRQPWLSALARLEWSLGEAFDAPDAPVLSRDALAAVAPEHWGELRFELQPCVRILRLAWPVDTWKRQVDRGESSEVAALDPESVDVLVWRSRERALHRRLDPFETGALTQAGRGRAFGSICEHLAERLGDDATPVRAAALLARWQADGLLISAKRA